MSQVALWLRALGGVGLGPHVLLALIDESIKWWAHQDLNLGPIDYGDGGDGFDPCCKSKNRKQFSPLPKLADTETELFPNRDQCGEFVSMHLVLDRESGH